MEIISRQEAKVLGLTKYYTGKSCKHGHLAERYVDSKKCQTCRIIKNRKYRAAHPEKKKEWDKRYAEKHVEEERLRSKKKRQDNPEYYKQYGKQYREENREQCRAWTKNWSRNNKDKLASYHAKRRAVKLQAIPVWYEENQIKQLYLKRDELSNLWGIDLHVDHIVPLQSKTVCGLHCWDNLQILEASINLSKSNTHIA